MSVFVDPATALRLARGTREEQVRRAELLRQARVGRAEDVDAPRARRRRWRIVWHRPVVAR